MACGLLGCSHTASQGWEDSLRKKVRAGTVIGHVATHGSSSVWWAQKESQGTLQNHSQTSEKGQSSGLSTDGNILSQPGLFSLIHSLQACLRTW